MEEYFTNLDFPKGISRNLSYLLGAQVIAKLPFNGSSLWLPPDGQKFKSNGTYIKVYMGVSLNGGTPRTPQNDHF